MRELVELFSSEHGTTAASGPGPAAPEAPEASSGIASQSCGPDADDDDVLAPGGPCKRFLLSLPSTIAATNLALHELIGSYVTLKNSPSKTATAAACLLKPGELATVVSVSRDKKSLKVATPRLETCQVDAGDVTVVEVDEQAAGAAPSGLGLVFTILLAAVIGLLFLGCF